MVGPSSSPGPVTRVVTRPLQQFLALEASGAIVLLLATGAALVWANLDPGGYGDVWDTPVSLRVGDWSLDEDLGHVVSDGLMAIFFLVIGLEVKRELVLGELRTPRLAALPAVAAVGGMVLPALLYLAVVAGRGGEGLAGWGIPLATDVAFAVGALAALGRRVPRGLMAFLLGVAVVDDIGAILVVAIAYTDTIALGWLAGAGVGLCAMVALNRIGVRYIGVYVILGIAVWLCTFESGVHATVAGVAVGLITPVGAHPSALTRAEHALHGWSSYAVLPLFALANAGIVLDATAIDAARDTGVAMAVAVGLVAGKLVGLSVGAALAVRLGIAELPQGVRWPHVVGAAGLAGIGFTVAIFIAGLAFGGDPALEAAAKIGILGGSVVALAVGVGVLLWATRRVAGRPVSGPGPAPRGG